MDATIFTTIGAENGIIKIPQKYQKNIDKKCKIIVIIETKTNTKKPSKRKLSAPMLDTKGFKFDREEAHER